MKFGFLLIAFLLIGDVHVTECCCEEPCLICREVNCRCEVYGCGEDEKMSLKKLILHFLQRAQRKTSDDDTLTPLVRILRDILKRASRLNINEEIGIRDMVLSRLRTLEAKCPCLDQPHETTSKRFLRLLLDKCLVCDCGALPCEGVWSKKTCDAPTGMYWFRTTDDDLRRERPKRGPCKPPEETRERGVCTDLGGPCSDFDDSYKCGRFLEEATEAVCKGFSICTDCDKCQVVVVNGKDEVWLLCDGCKPMQSPYVRFTGGGCPVKVAPAGKRRLIKIRTPYLQLNDFRPQRLKNKCDRSDFVCPNLSRLKGQKGRRRKICS